MTSPMRLDARLDGPPNRGLWLVKWLLLIPHLIVLVFLWLAVLVITLVALVAILVTGRYPRVLFEFTLGVFRWTWRVAFYGYAALGTDRYPPFSLGPEPDYPATLDIAYPEQLSRGLVLVKWWLLVLPHYLVVTFFVGGGGFVLWNFGDDWIGFDGGLVALLTLFAGVALLFTGRYPPGIFDFVVGMNRWVLRVGAYAALLTDAYPPFRLDTGGQDPATPAGPPLEPTEPAEPTAAGWTAGRTLGVVLGALLMLVGLAGTAAGGTLLWLDAQRDSTGYLASPVERYGDNGYALRFDADDVAPVDPDWPGSRDVLGDVRIHVSDVDSERLFAGIARTSDVDRYLDNVPHRRYLDGRRWIGGGSAMHVAPPPGMPQDTGIWAVSDSGTGTLTLDWVPEPGDWSLVVMDDAADRGVSADIQFTASAPDLRPVAIVILVGGVLVLLAGVALVVVAAQPGQRRG